MLHSHVTVASRNAHKMTSDMRGKADSQAPTRRILFKHGLYCSVWESNTDDYPPHHTFAEMNIAIQLTEIRRSCERRATNQGMHKAFL